MQVGQVRKRGDPVDRLIFRGCLGGIRRRGSRTRRIALLGNDLGGIPCIISANACGGTEPTVIVRARPAVMSALTCILFMFPPDTLNGPNSTGPIGKLSCSYPSPTEVCNRLC